MMSDVSQAQDSWQPALEETLKVIKGSQNVEKDILVEDCIFRLDLVKHHGRGDVNDYLLRDVSQQATFPDVIKRDEHEKNVEAEIKARKERELEERKAREEEQGDSESIGTTVMHVMLPFSNFF
ncbi:hypothetical protein QX201_002095 [Fusarium graminearum]